MLFLKFENGTIINVPENFEYDIQSNQLFDFDGVYGVFSNDFTIPFTAEVDEILGFVTLDIIDNKRYSKIPVSLLRDGANFSEGYIIVNGFDGKDVNVTYFSNNSDWIEDFKNLKVSELDTKDIKFDWKAESIIDAWNNDYNYNFPLINNGDLTYDIQILTPPAVFPMRYSVPISFNDFVPCVKVNYLIEKAFKKLGFNVEGNYKYIINDLFLSSGYKLPEINEKAIKPLFNFRHYNNTLYSNLSYGIKFTPQQVLDYCEVYNTISTDDIKLTPKGEACAFRPTSIGWFKGNIDFVMKVPTSVYQTWSGVERIQLGQMFLVCSKFTTPVSITQSSDYTHTRTSSDGFTYTIKNINFEFYADTIESYYFNLQNPIPLHNPNGDVYITFRNFKLQKRDANVIEGETVYGDYFLPDIEVSTLLKEIIARYNCVINTKNKTVTIQSLSNLDYTNSVDLTNKVSNILSSNYSDLQGDIGQISEFNVQSDSEEYPTLGSGILNIDYKYLEKRKEVFSSSFKSVEVTDSMRIPSSTAIGDTGQLRFKMAKIETEARLIIAQRKSVVDIWRNQYNVKNNFWLLEDSLLQDIRVFRGDSSFITSENPYYAWYCLNNPNINLDFNKSLAFQENKDLVNGGFKEDKYSVIAKSYRTIKNIYNKPQILEVEVILNEELDLTKLVYLQQTGKYYLIQKQTVSSDTPIVTLNLIQI